MTAHFAVMEVWADGNPVDLQTYDELGDALDRRDQERKERPGIPRRGPAFFVHDLDDPERGWLDWDDVEIGADSTQNVRVALALLKKGLV